MYTQRIAPALSSQDFAHTLKHNGAKITNHRRLDSVSGSRLLIGCSSVPFQNARIKLEKNALNTPTLETFRHACLSPDSWVPCLVGQREVEGGVRERSPCLFVVALLLRVPELCFGGTFVRVWACVCLRVGTCNIGGDRGGVQTKRKKGWTQHQIERE